MTTAALKLLVAGGLVNLAFFELSPVRDFLEIGEGI